MANIAQTKTLFFISLFLFFFLSLQHTFFSFMDGLLRGRRVYSAVEVMRCRGGFVSVEFKERVRVANEHIASVETKPASRKHFGPKTKQAPQPVEDAVVPLVLDGEFLAEDPALEEPEWAVDLDVAEPFSFMSAEQAEELLHSMDDTENLLLDPMPPLLPQQPMQPGPYMHKERSPVEKNAAENSAAENDTVAKSLVEKNTTEKNHSKAPQTLTVVPIPLDAFGAEKEVSSVQESTYKYMLDKTVRESPVSRAVFQEELSDDPQIKKVQLMTVSHLISLANNNASARLSTNAAQYRAKNAPRLPKPHLPVLPPQQQVPQQQQQIPVQMPQMQAGFPHRYQQQYAPSPEPELECALSDEELFQLTQELLMPNPPDRPREYDPNSLVSFTSEEFLFDSAFIDTPPQLPPQTSFGLPVEVPSRPMFSTTAVPFLPRTVPRAADALHAPEPELQPEPEPEPEQEQELTPVPAPAPAKPTKPVLRDGPMYEGGARNKELDEEVQALDEFVMIAPKKESTEEVKKKSKKAKKGGKGKQDGASLLSFGTGSALGDAGSAQQSGGKKPGGTLQIVRKRNVANANSPTASGSGVPGRK